MLPWKGFHLWVDTEHLQVHSSVGYAGEGPRHAGEGRWEGLALLLYVTMRKWIWSPSGVSPRDSPALLFNVIL